mmetsp:Transcript_27922/g.50809  ORF Transcript_27922/g.50809 Transcript_27922/m.50809 type:complete len:89 (+) Transcript_27922:838-1104(+)
MSTIDPPPLQVRDQGTATYHPRPMIVGNKRRIVNPGSSGWVKNQCGTPFFSDETNRDSSVSTGICCEKRTPTQWQVKDGIDTCNNMAS